MSNDSLLPVQDKQSVPVAVVGLVILAGEKAHTYAAVTFPLKKTMKTEKSKAAGWKAARADGKEQGDEI